MSRFFGSRLAAVAVLAALSSPSLAGADAKSGSDKRMICKVESGTTSRIPAVRRCKTATEWRADRERQQADHSDREDFLLHAPQDSTGVRGVSQGAPN